MTRCLFALLDACRACLLLLLPACVALASMLPGGAYAP